MAFILQGKTILLGVAGSVAAHHAATLASHLAQAGAQVDVVMTHEATQFIGALTFETITHRPVVTDTLSLLPDSSIAHIAMAKRADVFVIAPATAPILAKLAHGFADDPISAAALATRAPLVIAPAIEPALWENATTRENVRQLCARGATLVEPGSGRNWLVDVDTIIDATRAVLGRQGDLAQRKIVITAGGTQEAIDPVRVIANLSSGRMGFALAEAARDRGAQVTLIAGVTHLRVPRGGIELLSAPTWAKMWDVVLREIQHADALIMSAAVTDFRPVKSAKQKIKPSADETFVLELVRNQDILGEVARASSRLVPSDPHPAVVVGFAAETEDVQKNARKKLESKNLDLIVAHPVAETALSETARSWWIPRHTSRAVELPVMAKEEFAGKILDFIAEQLRR